MTKIKELIQDFKLNQEILGRVGKYVDLCMDRLHLLGKVYGEGFRHC
jgi:integrase/recombinase XerD